jgi:hypothetical protein
MRAQAEETATHDERKDAEDPTEQCCRGNGAEEDACCGRRGGRGERCCGR